MFSKLSTLQNYGWGDLETAIDTSLKDKMHCDSLFGVDPFYIEKGNYVASHDLNSYFWCCIS